jgi:hypothetical protein
MIATYGRGYNFINSICGQAVGKSCGGVSSAFISFMPIHQIITTRMQSAHVRTSRRNQRHHSNDPSIENYASNISTHKGDNDDKYQKQVNQERLGRRQLRREKELRREKQLAVISIILFAVVVFSIVILYYVWKSREVKIIRKERHPPNPFEHVASTSSSSITARDHQREKEIYDQWSQGLQELNEAILSDNVSRSDILLNPRLLGFPDGTNNPLLEASSRSTHPLYPTHGPFFRISRMFDTLPWQENVDCVNFKPFLDYTDSSLYEYPSLSDIQDNMKGYPKLSTLDDVLAHWPQDEIDHPPLPIQETLQHFDYTKPTQLEEAWKYLHQQLPFKLTNVPELVQANEKWTDEYVAQQFDTNQATGSCQESPTSFFAFYDKRLWNIETMGLPPTRNNDFTFQTWAKHARYADATQLPSNRPHFYWQAGVAKEERYLSKGDPWSFISRDLPSFSATENDETTILCSDPSQAKGIQCRFGERGVTAANHYDGGQNMVGMVSGAKRYILSPPNQCSKLGIVTTRGTAMYRHSLLNLERLPLASTGKLSSKEEKEWLETAGKAMVVETVLRSGEVLFIPSHWFHYIVGLQKNAQCNVRSGVQVEGNEQFGGQYDTTPEGCRPSSLVLD